MIRAQRERAMGRAEDECVTQARLEGAQLAIRTAHHLLNDRLALAIGYADLLADDPALPPDARELSQRCLAGAQEAAELLRALGRIRQLVESHRDQPYGPLIDLDHSTC
jgi:hypothetical protein